MTHNRIIAHVRSAAPGDTLVCVGGLHGNERAGIAALERVATGLEQRGLVRGEFVAIAGNVGALDAGQRYLDRDLNRHWGRPPLRPPAREDEERVALTRCLHDAFRTTRGQVTLIDLHTVSGPGQPFAVFADTLVSRAFARQFHCPVILGLEEHLDSTLVDWASREGHTAVAFEGGQHDDPRSTDALEDIVWHALGKLGLIQDAPRPERIIAETRHLPPVLELVYRHAIAPSNGFRMRPGFASFDVVHEGQPVADTPNGPVTVPQTARLLMPLYQAQGDDGFFLVRSISSAWLTLSAALRRARLGRFIHWLPGVSRHATDADLVIVDRNVAKWLALEVLHLLGFRRVKVEGNLLYAKRRRHDSP